MTELLALPGNFPSIENYRFPGEMFTWRKRVTRLGEFPVERGCLVPSRFICTVFIQVYIELSDIRH